MDPNQFTRLEELLSEILACVRILADKAKEDEADTGLKHTYGRKLNESIKKGLQ